MPGLAGRDLAPDGPDLWKTDPSPFVISVGNLALGGRGKTPLVAWLARRLVEAGHRPAILSRGYRRRRPEAGVVIVSDGQHRLADLDRSGDEPLMLARLVPGAAVLVCDVRTMAAAVAEHVLGATVLLLDDGFQHVAMRRDVDLVVVAPRDLADRRLPFGRLRSPLRALSRADAVLVDGEDRAAVAPAITPLLRGSDVPLFTLGRRLTAPEPLEPARPMPAVGATVVVLAGIAQPERFHRAVEAAGWHVAEAIFFSDHHPFNGSDLRRVADAVRRHGARGVLTTAKDAVRLLPLRPLPVPIAAVPLEVSVAPEEDFARWLDGRLPQARR